jgi:hypothetical protein
LGYPRAALLAYAIALVTYNLKLAAVHHSENSAAFPGRRDGPVKGMTF